MFCGVYTYSQVCICLSFCVCIQANITLKTYFSMCNLVTVSDINSYHVDLYRKESDKFYLFPATDGCGSFDFQIVADQFWSILGHFC